MRYYDYDSYLLLLARTREVAHLASYKLVHTPGCYVLLEWISHSRTSFGCWLVEMEKFNFIHVRIQVLRLTLVQTDKQGCNVTSHGRGPTLSRSCKLPAETEFCQLCQVLFHLHRESNLYYSSMCL